MRYDLRVIEPIIIEDFPYTIYNLYNYYHNCNNRLSDKFVSLRLWPIFMPNNYCIRKKRFLIIIKIIICMLSWFRAIFQKKIYTQQFQQHKKTKKL